MPKWPVWPPQHTKTPKSRANRIEPEQEQAQPGKIGKKGCFHRKSVRTLADCEWRAAAPGLKPPPLSARPFPLNWRGWSQVS